MISVMTMTSCTTNWSLAALIANRPKFMGDRSNFTVIHPKRAGKFFRPLIGDG
jgi:hypothetical protein